MTINAATAALRSILLATVAALVAAPTSAQQQEPPQGIELAAQYQTRTQPLLAVRSFDAPVDVANGAEQVHAIVRKDLELSDRFRLFEVPAALASGDVDYAQWNGLDVVYVVTAQVEAADAGGMTLAVTPHDVVYGRALPTFTARVPDPSSAEFRMAVHAVSDEIVRRITGQPGMAATRVAFVRQNGNGTNDLLIVDSDGENLRRLTGSEGLIYSPAWSPDGQRLAYTIQAGEGWELVERDMRTGRSRSVAVPNTNLLMTPTYSPDGRSIAYAANINDRMELFATNVDSDRFQQLTRGPGYSFSPSYAPDGRRMAFNSNRLGNPHIYVMDAGGGAALLMTPYVPGQRGYYTSPEWAPEGTAITFHGHWNARGAYQIFLGDAARPGGAIRQLTREGNNQDPSFAPDGRHIAYTASGVGRDGLYVIDATTGTARQLSNGARHRMAAWSPALARVSGQ